MRRPTAFVLWLAHLSRADEPPSHTYLGCYVDKTKKRDLEERVDGTIVNDISAVQGSSGFVLRDFEDEIMNKRLEPRTLGGLSCVVCLVALSL